MTNRKYPLDPLVRLRERQVDDKTRGLSEAIADREAAERARRAAEQARELAERRAQELRDIEQAALLEGQLRAGDLQRAHAWEVGVAAEQKQLTHQVSTAADGEKSALQLEGEARAELASRKADAEVVNKDKQRFTDRVKRAQEARDEEAAAEVWRPKRD